MLIANKADVTYTPGERVVSTAEGRQRAEDIDAHAFHEISVRESVEQVTPSLKIFPPYSFTIEINWLTSALNVLHRHRLKLEQNSNRFIATD